MTSSVKIEFARLESKTSSRGPYAHIHGFLNFEIDGRSVPHMGYFGPDDVCFNAWVGVFVGIRHAVQHRLPDYTFDEFEQGQSAFLFEVKPGSQIALSIVQSASGEGYNDSDWQQVLFRYEDFNAAFLDFKRLFLAEIAQIAPRQRQHWREMVSG